MALHIKMRGGNKGRQGLRLGAFLKITIPLLRFFSSSYSVGFSSSFSRRPGLTPITLFRQVGTYPGISLRIESVSRSFVTLSRKTNNSITYYKCQY